LGRKAGRFWPRKPTKNLVTLEEETICSVWHGGTKMDCQELSLTYFGSWCCWRELNWKAAQNPRKNGVKWVIKDPWKVEAKRGRATRKGEGEEGSQDGPTFSLFHCAED
jgi:hypothetical protein